MRKKSLAEQNHDKERDDSSDPIIYTACREWQAEWGLGQSWRCQSFHQIKQKLRSIQVSFYENFLFNTKP